VVADKADLRVAARALNSAAIHLLRGMRDIDRQSGLTAARLSALSVIVFGGPQPLGRLARIEGVASPTMTRIVDGLERLGLAHREPHPDNARTTVVRATDEGDALMRKSADRRVEAIIVALRDLAASERSAIVRASPALLKLPRGLPSRSVR
jgi:DNA-binding MarR family transcriptional regulator